jgi:hypothetical protein
MAECRRLEDVLETALQALEAGIGTLSRHDYARMKVIVHQAQLDSEVAGLRIVQHERSHTETGASSGRAGF